MKAVRAAQAFLPTGLAHDVVIEHDDVTIRAVRSSRRGDPVAVPGIVIPGLVNAHLHLELSFAAGRVPGGDGLVPWVGSLLALPRPSSTGSAARAALELAAAGTSWVCDISNSGTTASLLAAAGLSGIVQHEQLGFGRATLAERIASVPAHDQRQHGLTVRPSPHAVYSTPPALIVAAARPSSVPASIHLSEDPGERPFTEEGIGPFAELLDRLGVDWRWFTAPGVSPARALDQLGVLGAGLLLVHGVHLDHDDRRLLVARGAGLCLCPRSNRHVGGLLPELPALLAEGVRLCLGTDSLASSADLDVLGEIASLLVAFPSVDPALLLALATREGAALLGLGDAGRIAVGAPAKLVLLEIETLDALREHPVPRRWLVGAA